MRVRHAVALLWLCILAGCGRLAGHPLASTAKDEVSRNERVAVVLGSPVTFGSGATGRVSEADGIGMIQLEAKGPKGAGTVVVEGKKLGDEWGVTMLELRPAGGGEHLRLTADLEARTGTDTPKFDPAATPPPAASPTTPPPGDIEIALPPGAPGA